MLSVDSIRGRLFRRLFGLSEKEVSCETRGFNVTNEGVRSHLEGIGSAFLTGYHAGLASSHDFSSLESALRLVAPERRGFAFEGTAMSLSLLDGILPGNRKRWQRFLSGPAKDHKYVVHVGYGWSMARLRIPIDVGLSRLDPVLGWLAVDGYGFHEGYFNWRGYLLKKSVPPGTTEQNSVFYQGLGRSLWFVAGSDINRISNIIAGLPIAHESDLWSGVGLACGYAGGITQDQVVELRNASGRFLPFVAQGTAFAAKARILAGNPTAHNDLACRTLCGCSAEEAASLCDQTLSEQPVPKTYFGWRRALHDKFASERVTH